MMEIGNRNKQSFLKEQESFSEMQVPKRLPHRRIIR